MPKVHSFRLPPGIGSRPFALAEVQQGWGIKPAAAWQRLNRAKQQGLVYRLSQGRYAITTRGAATLNHDAEKVLTALRTVRNVRSALTGIDVLSGSLHYVPMRYPHLVLVQRRGLERVQRALASAGYLAVPATAAGAVWDASPTAQVVLLRATNTFRGVPDGAALASPERAFLDLLLEIRHHNFPLPIADLARVLNEAPVSVRARIERLGRALRIRPFSGASTTRYADLVASEAER